MKSNWVLAAVVAAVVAVGSFASADDKAEKKEFACKCPLSGAPAKEAKFAEFLGKKVYFCCENCQGKFEADPEKFAMKALHQMLVTGEIMQVACPLTGKECNPEKVSELEGAKVAFCCDGCKGKFEKADLEAKLAMIFGELDKGFTTQTVCPVSDHKADASVSVEHDGKKVYLCCEGCIAEFNKDPAKFLAKLPKAKEKK